MKFVILDVYPDKKHRLVKDTAGGYGTGNDVLFVRWPKPAPGVWIRITLMGALVERAGFTRGTCVPSTCYRARTAPGFLDGPVVT